MPPVDTSPTRVVFRRFPDDGAIIALFPDLIEGDKRTVQSYMHCGQHAPAHFTSVVEGTDPALPDEYRTLHHELTGIGYNLTVWAAPRIKLEVIDGD